jgi:glutamate-1-semialdehyde 2,1-aminomutase
VGFSPSAGFNEVDSAGIPVALSSSVVVTHFNDPEMLRVQFHEYGDRLACLILEPIMGGGGGMPATVEYLRTARELTEKYGAVLIFDEVITGFRFRAGSAGALYGIQPDLTTMGKIIGGGMPLAAVGGREVIMRLTGRASGGKVKFLGGTYSGHPSTMVAAKTMIEYLVAHEPEIYPRLARLGEQASRLVEDTFAQEGIYARCTGAGNAVVPHSSIIRVHFPYLKEQSLNSPNDVMDPTKCDVTLSEKVLRLALITEDINTEHGLGALSTAHTDADLAQLGMALQRVAQRIRPYVF